MRVLKDMKISRKLVYSFLCISIITAIVGGIGIYGITKMKATSDDMYARRLVSMPYMTKSIQSLASIQAASRDAVINADDDATFQADEQAFEKYDEMFRTNSAALIKTINTAEWIQKLQAANKSYDEEFVPEIKKVFDAAKSDPAAAKDNLNTSHKADNAITDVYSQFLDYRIQTAATQNASDNQMAVIIYIILGVVTLLGFGISLSMGIKIARSIGKPINELVYVAGEFANRGKLDTEITYHSKNELGQLSDSFRSVFSALQAVVTEVSTNLTRMAGGDLTVDKLRDYKGDFEPIPKAMNSIVVSLNDTFAAVKVSSEQVNSGSTQISNGAQELAQGAAEQASSIEELSATITDVADKVKENTEHVVNVSKYVDDATGNIEDSNAQMQRMLSAMDEISLSSDEISKINKVIDDIAFQTNILALNAAVEAARAGAAGKGFAVVADEVRNLASKSAEAAKQTTQLIENSIQKVKDGTLIADSTAKALESVSMQMAKVDETVGKIKQASVAQSAAIAQITQGIEQVSAVVQTNSATAEESAAASEELSAQAEMLNKEVEKVRLKGRSEEPSPEGEPEA